MLATTLVAGLLSGWAAEVAPLRGARRIPLASPSGDFRAVRSQVIDSREKLDALVRSLNRRNDFDRGGGKDDYPAFAKTLAAARVDFSKEVMVLLRHDEASASTRVRFRLTEDADGTLTATITRDPGGAGVAMVATHGFAFVATRDQARRLVLWHVTRVSEVALPP